MKGLTLFFNYRFDAYCIGMRELFEQIKQFSVMIVLLFYTATPGLLALIFLWMGKVVQEQVGQDGSQIHAWALLVLQSVLFLVIRPVVLNSANLTFQRSLFSNLWPLRVMDGVLMTISNVPFWIAVLLASQMGWSKVALAPHFSLFIVAQLIFGLISLYRPTAVFISLVSAFLLVGWFSTLFLWLSFIIIWLICLTLLPLDKYLNVASVSNFKANSQMSFWLIWVKEHASSVLWRFGVMFVLLFTSDYVLTLRPDLIEVIGAFCIALSLLLWGSFIFATKPLLKQYLGFWRSLKLEKKIYRQFFGLHLCVLFFVWGGLYVWFGMHSLMLFFIPCIPLYVWLAWLSAQLFSVMWCSSVFIIFLIYELLYLSA
ncbi:DUF6136 family protein [Pseudoalteromonas xiamenensis]|uniref:Uncharacterized protein n=1 Tax=Pseudoalteromonas xiamenensis TaxID=882626 RepID=A0A975DHK6_9GAMM|nr:DUF6136 family protein [Pseudoalteromonas xiamenensis]QTH71913.1 hypothetical protein J5O05_03020 [Pseudoalteromonas xiamenensis]